MKHPFALSERLAAKREPRVEGRAVGQRGNGFQCAPFDSGLSPRFARDRPSLRANSASGRSVSRGWNWSTLSGRTVCRGQPDVRARIL